jgi:hypothetical protein
MAHEEWTPPFLDGPVQHARDCAYVLTPGSTALFALSQIALATDTKFAR